MNTIKFERGQSKVCIIKGRRFGAGIITQAQQHVDAFHNERILSAMEPEVDSFGMELTGRLAEIEELPIDRLNEREGMLVDLLVFIVNHETEDGELTAKAGNKALESMDYWNSLDLYTKEAGFKRLGNGHFSIAYSHPKLPGRVIKVGMKKEDSGAAYVAFCRMHQGRAGIPVIHAVSRHKGCYTVVMDELASAREIRHTVEGCDAYNAVCEAVELGSAQHWKDEGLSEYNCELVDTGEMIHKFFKGIARFDMHTGNVMLDKEGRLVITDPVSFSHDDREFSVDPEALLAEVEKIVQQTMIKRCKARWLKRQTEGIEEVKRLKKRKKVRAKKRRAEWAAQYIAWKREDIFSISCRHAVAVFATRQFPNSYHLHNVHRFHSHRAMRPIVQARIDRDINEIQEALIQGRMELPMDKRLDAQFFRG